MLANLVPITEAVFDEKKAQVATSEISVSMETSYKCKPCAKIFKTSEQRDQHSQSKKHKKAEKAYKASHPDEANSSMFKSITFEGGSDFLSDLNRSINGRSEQSEQMQVEENSDSSKSSTNQRTTLESLRICLFCNEETSGVKKNLDHMRLKHSFLIMDIECLINLKGLLAYIAERIQLGKLCLNCNKQFRTAERTQQHMLDKGHCMMPFDDDTEFELFYDFARAYKHLNFKTKMLTSGEDEVDSEQQMEEEKRIERDQRILGDDQNGVEANEGESEDDWEDIDMEDGDFIEEVDSEHEQDAEESKDFEVVSKENEDSASFTMINTSEAHSKPSKTTESFDVIGDSASSINQEQRSGTTSSYLGSQVFGQRQRKGKTRAEAFAALDIQKAELMSTNEIRLPSGKIIGHRDHKHIYRQRTRLPDQREAVVINKLALEYRRMANGVVAKVSKNALSPVVQRDFDRATKASEKHYQKEVLQIQAKNHKLNEYNHPFQMSLR